MDSKYTINEILDALAAQQQRGETSLVVTIEPGLIPDALNALRTYRKLFAPFIPGQTDTAPIYAAYELMRQAHADKITILLFVECQTMEQLREALEPLPIQRSPEWRREADRYSLVGTAELNRLDPERYLREILERIG
jgi:hypothetical protein